MIRIYSIDNNNKKYCKTNDFEVKEPSKLDQQSHGLGMQRLLYRNKNDMPTILG